MRKALLSLILILALTAAHTASAQVLINEVDTAGGTGQWIEFFNPTGAPIDVSGWQVQMYYDNLPGSNIGTIIIPGAAGSMTTVIPNEGFMVISDNVSTPALPVGVVRVTTTTFPTQWFAGIPYSIGLYDNVGNGVDYLAASNSNFFGAPLALGGTNTEWAGHPSAINPIGGGAPILGGQLAGAVDAVTYRHTRLDSDDASDWTNNGATGTGTPGAHNFGQAAFSTGIMPVASFKTNLTCGTAPLLITFQNTSSMETEVFGGGVVVWDFDATANPLVNTSSNYHEAQTFIATADVTLFVQDVGGFSNTTAPTTITANVGGGISPITGCAAENFESFPAFVADPCGGPTGPDPVTGFEFRGSTPNARLRIVDRNTLTAIIPGDATAVSGPNVAILDTTSGNANAQLILHIDTTQVNPTSGEFQITYSLLENNDELHAEDYVAVQDGITTGLRGNGITGGFGGSAGLDGFSEVVVNAWNQPAAPILAPNINRVWVTTTHTIDLAFFTANGLVPGSTDFRLIFSQLDNVTFEGNDGLAIDQIEVLPINTSSGGSNMQPASSSFAAMDMNSALNAGCQFVAANAAGPFFASATVGGLLDLQFRGAPNQAIIFMSDLNNTLTDNVLVNPVPGSGELNLGTPTPGVGVGVTNIAILADGTRFDFVNSIFNLNTFGELNLLLPVNLPMGNYAFQSIMFTGNSQVIQFSNPISLTVNP